MGTDNPKVSAYVPQVLKDRLKKFREERDNISESQAVTIILAEYFQVPEVLGRSTEGSPVGGVTLARMEALEQTLTEIAKVVGCRLDELDDKVEKISKLSAVHQVTSAQITSEDGQLGSLPNELPRELPEQTVAINPEKDNSLLDELSSELSNESLTQELEQDILPSELESEPSVNEEREAEKDSIESLGTSEEQASESTVGLPSELPNVSDSSVKNGGDESDKPGRNTAISLTEQQGSSLPTNLLGEPLINERFKPIHGKQVARRWNGSYGNLQNQKSKLSPEDFVKWLTKKDPDHIDWKPIDKPKGHYLPASELSSEILGRLLKWLEDNPV